MEQAVKTSAAMVDVRTSPESSEPCIAKQRDAIVSRPARNGMQGYRVAMRAMLLLLVLAVQPGFAVAQRIALLIGNSSYEVGRLTNPRNDVREMEGALRSLGFDVRSRTDLSQKDT